MPGIPTWKGVYVMVLVVFAILVVAMWGIGFIYS